MHINKKRNYLLIFLLGIILNLHSTSIDSLDVPQGFEISIYADNLESPRQIAETDKGFIIVGSKNG